jgi:hypothetical protein
MKSPYVIGRKLIRCDIRIATFVSGALLIAKSQDTRLLELTWALVPILKVWSISRRNF